MNSSNRKTTDQELADLVDSVRRYRWRQQLAVFISCTSLIVIWIIGAVVLGNLLPKSEETASAFDNYLQESDWTEMIVFAPFAAGCAIGVYLYRKLEPKKDPRDELN